MLCFVVLAALERGEKTFLECISPVIFFFYVVNCVWAVFMN